MHSFLLILLFSPSLFFVRISLTILLGLGIFGLMNGLKGRGATKTQDLVGTIGGGVGVVGVGCRGRGSGREGWLPLQPILSLQV